MSSGQWEVVGRNRKDKSNNKKQAQNDKNKTVPAPKVEDILPLSQIKSIYSNVGKSNKENKKPQEKENKKKETTKSKPAKKVEKKTEHPKPKPPKSIESALTMINVDDFKSSLEMSKERFPDAPLVWLKELSAYLNTKITVELNDPVFTTKSDKYPMSAMPGGIRHVMEKAVHDAGKPTVQLFFDFSLTAMANDMSKGLPAIGHKIWIQFMANQNPQIAVTHLEKYFSLRTSYQNRQAIGLSILWALGQGGLKDFHAGLKVFKDFMLPLLEMKNYSRFIIKYLSQLVTRHETVPISKDNFFYLFDLVNTKRNLPNENKLELTAINKKLKEMLIKDAQKKSGTFFEPVLSKLVATNPSVLQKDLCDTLYNFLIKNSNCYNIWKQCYSKYYQQSYILLKHISDHWRKLNNRLDKKQFKELLNKFLAEKPDLLAKHKKDSTILETEKICKALIEKMTVTKSFPWRFVTFIIFLSTTILLLYDLQQHGNWRKSHSVKTLKDIGVWEYGEKAWGGAQFGFNWTKQRIEEYAPGYIDATGEVLYPYVELARDLGKISYNVGEQYVTIIKEKIPVFIETIERYAPGLLEQIEKTSRYLVNTILEFMQKAYNYLSTEVFVGQLSPENLQKVTVNSFHTIQKYTMEYYNWIFEKVNSVLAGK